MICPEQIERERVTAFTVGTVGYQSSCLSAVMYPYYIYHARQTNILDECHIPFLGKTERAKRNVLAKSKIKSLRIVVRTKILIT